jgi:hypothetical protein
VKTTPNVPLPLNYLQWTVALYAMRYALTSRPAPRILRHDH